MQSRKVQDRFRDWNYIHKGVVVSLAALFFGAFVRAILAINGGAYIVQEERIIPQSTDVIWPWIYGESNRPRWQAHLTDVSKLKGLVTEPKSTRLLFWRLRGKHWTGIEETMVVIPERLYETYQESDKDTRNLKIEIDVISECLSRVQITETVRPVNYSDRFWAFLKSGESEDRLETSLEALEGWINNTSETACTNTIEK